MSTAWTTRGLRQHPRHQLPSHFFTMYVKPNTLKLSLATTCGPSKMELSRLPVIVEGGEDGGDDLTSEPVDWVLSADSEYGGANSNPWLHLVYDPISMSVLTQK